MIDAGKAAKRFAVDWGNWWVTASDALLSAQRNSEAAWLKAEMSAPELEGELFLNISSAVYYRMGGSQETIWDSPVEELGALLVSINALSSEGIKRGSPSSQDRVALRSKILEWGIKAERLGHISLSWNAMMQAAFTPEVIAGVMQFAADMERFLIAIDKAAAAQTEWAHELSYCATAAKPQSSGMSATMSECTGFH